MTARNPLNDSLMQGSTPEEDMIGGDSEDPSCSEGPGRTAAAALDTQAIQI